MVTKELGTYYSMMHINLTQGMVAVVDDGDFDLVRGYPWRSLRGRKTYYAICYKRSVKGEHELMHTMITGWSFVDHINGNGLDNQRSNLRQATHQQNMWNANHSYGVSPYKGVHWVANMNKWRARIEVSGKKIHLGYFKTEIEAATAYNVAASEHFGEFAFLNKI